MRNFVLLLPAILLTVCVSVLQANTIHVPADSATIQAGINGAVNGDTVLVADGTYTGDGNRDIDFNGKAIVVMSENGPESCIIDCEGSESDPHRGFYFHSGEDSSSVVQGFTIQNGFVYGVGGGIYCSLSSPTITGNTITGNAAIPAGGGIFCGESSPTITDNTITGNTAHLEPMAGATGGGIFCGESSPHITGNTISGNTSESWGGGIYCSNSSPNITGNAISENTAWEEGGGIFCDESSPTIVGNTITGNTSNSGGGIICYSSSPTITNSILWGDSLEEIYVYSGDPIVTYSDIEAGWTGEGNIDEDPLFVDPENGNYELSPGSPCIDAGDPTDDVPWGGGCRIDMGAYEFWKGYNCHKVPIQWR